MHITFRGAAVLRRPRVVLSASALSAMSAFALMAATGAEAAQYESRFAAPITVSALPQIAAANDLAAGDVDGNGKQDLVVVTDDSSVITYLQDGDGDFTGYTTNDGGGRLTEIQLGDLDDDGDLDAVVLTDEQAGPLALRNIGDGRFFVADGQELLPDDAAARYKSVQVSDVNSDGAADVVVGRTDTNKVLALTSNGNPTTPGVIAASDFDTQTLDLTGTQVQAVAVGKLTPSGRAGIAAASRTGGAIDTFEWSTDNSRFEAGSVEYSSNAPVTSLAIGDLNNDGVGDLVYGDATGQVAASLSNPQNPFSARQGIGVGLGEGPVTDLGIADLNGDLKRDVVALEASSTGNGSRVARYMNAGQTWNPQSTVSTEGAPRGLVVADIDGDQLGLPDFAQITTNAGNESVVQYAKNTTVVNDVTNPTIELNSPVDGATYQLGERVVVDFSCSDDDLVTTCEGTQSDGSELDTSEAGNRTFSVQAQDASGNVFYREVSYTIVDPNETGGGSGGGPDGPQSGDEPTGGSGSTPSTNPNPSTSPAPTTTTGPTTSPAPQAAPAAKGPAPAGTPRLSKNRRILTARISLKTSGPGTVSVSATTTASRRTAGGKRTKKALAFATSSAKKVKGGSTVSVPLKVSSSGRKARFTAKTIPVTFTTTFKPQGGGKAVRTKRTVTIKVRP